MGPRLFRRGNTGTIEAAAGFLAGLQWGHAFSDVEMDPLEFDILADELTSMGPRLFRRGNLKPCCASLLDRPTSMVPRLFRRGNRGHFSGSPDAEKMAFFERLVFVSVPLAFSSRFCLGIRYQAPFRAVPGFLVTTKPLAAVKRLSPSGRSSRDELPETRFFCRLLPPEVPGL